MRVTIKFTQGAENTAATLNINSLGAVSVTNVIIANTN